MISTYFSWMGVLYKILLSYYNTLNLYILNKNINVYVKKNTSRI